MKKSLIVAIIFCSLGIASSAQDPQHNAYAIRVEQDYECWNKCDDGYPHLDKMMVTIGDSEKTDSAGIIKKIDDKHYSAIFTKKLGENEDFTSITVKDETRGFGRKHNTFTYTDKINRDELHLGENKNIRYYSDAVKCSCCHREGYSITTSVIIDRAIDVNIEQDSSTLTVEEGELELTFSEFYDSRKNIELQYMCNDSIDKSWRNVARQPHITSGGKVKLRYEDIVGKYSDSNERYKNCIGKHIDFRVVKTLLDGTKTYGEIVQARFYHKGPEFEIADIRRPFCEDINPLQIRVKFGNDVRDFSKMANLPGYEWIIKDGYCTFELNKCGAPDVEGYRVLDGIPTSESENIASSLLDYLKQPIIGKEWTIQLQYSPKVSENEEGQKAKDGANTEEDDAMMPVSKDFTLPAKLDSIKAWQSEDYLFESDGKKYHLYNKKEPYVVLKITDNDTIGPGRMPYKIYNSDGNFLTDITEALTDVSEEEKDAWFKTFESEKKADFILNCAKKWYKKHQNTDSVRCFSLSTDVYNTKDGVKAKNNRILTLSTERTVYISTNDIASYTVYKIVGNWTSPYMSYYTDNNTTYGMMLGPDGNIYETVNSKQTEKQFGINGTYDFVDANGLCLLLSKDNGSNYYSLYVYTLERNEYPLAIDNNELAKDVLRNKHDIYLDGNCNVTTLFDKVVKYYESNNKINPTSWSLGRKYTTKYSPDSISNIIVGDSAIIYTDKDKKSHEEFFEDPTETQFIKRFNAGRAQITESTFIKEWEAYKQRCWQQYLLQNYDYHIHDINTNQDDELILIDNDGCSYTIPYRVNVLDNFNITENVDKSEDKATLKVQPGGSTDYYYNGEKISGETEIDLSNLHWGDNIVEFTDENGDVRYTHIVSLLPNVTFTTTPQTCSEPNGAIKILGNDVGKCTQWQHKNSSMPNSDEYWKEGLDNLKAGTYAVRGKFGDLWVDFGKQTVANEVFSVEVSNVKDATEIGGTGSVELKIENQTKDITWTDLDTQATYTDYKQATFTTRKYHWTATHALDGCTLPIEFEIKAPKVELVNASVTYNADTKEAHVHVEGKKNDLVSSYQFTVDGETFANDTTLSGKNAGDGINLGLKYVSSQDNKTDTTNIWEIKLLSYAPQVTVDTAYNNKRCPSHLGRVTLSGASGGELAVDNSNQYEKIEKDGFQYIPNNPNDTIHTLHFRKTETISANYDFGKIENTIVHDVCNVVIAEPKQPYIRIAKLDVTCKGSGNGELYIDDAQNVRGAAQYSLDKKKWYSSAITSLAPETYHIYTRDSVCPSDIDSCDIKIEEPTNKLQVSIADNGITNPTCANNDGKIVLKASGGWDDYLAYTRKLTAEEYENALDTTDIEKNLRIEGLEFGNHTIYVHDGGGCVVAVEAELKQYYSPQIINTTAIPARCYGSADGEMAIDTVIVDPSVKGLDLLLSVNGGESETLSSPYQTIIKGLKEGYYTLRVSDANECKSDEITVHISQPKPLKLEARLLDDGRIHYNGGSDGRMKITVSGGNSGNNNIVTYGDGLAVVHTGVPYIVGGMSKGPIEISAKDEKGCPSNDTTLTFIEPDEPITIEAESQPALCHAMTGSVKVTATGGWGGHKIRLVGERESRNSGEQSETTFESLYAGDYEIEVEDKHGAKATQTVRVDAPEPISHELITTPDHCDGNGSATIKLSGGMPDYTTIFVVGSDTTEIAGSTVNIGNLVGGREYELHTRDANACESVIAFPQPDNRLTAEIKYAYNANGSATLTAEVKGGIAPYTYKWRNVSGGEELGTSSIQTVTKSGLYRLEIADASGCSYNTMQDVLMAGSIVMRVKSVTRATNPENNNGTATIICKATQPTDLRSYHLETDTWTSSITMQDETTIKLEGLRPGHYSVEGELDNGNMQTAMFEIAPYVEMKVIKTAVKHVSAPGRNDASVVIDFVGGIAPYTVNDTATYETSHIELTNLAAGSIALSVADSTGNVLTKEVEILEPEPLVVTLSRVDSASCFSYSDGSVQLTATGGWPGYQFANGNGDYRNSAYFGELNAGERTFKVVDKYGVEDSVKVTVGEPDMLRASVAAIDSVSCKGLNDGVAHFAVTGGTAPYRTIYEKETLDGTDVAHLLSGSYVMKFTDSHNCKSPDTISIYIPEPDLLELANDYVTHTTCELDNGKIAIEVKGGSLPYRYEWKENGATYGGAKTVNMVRSEAENLKQNGLYHIDITDLHGCHTQYEMRIEHSENPRVMGVATTDVLCYGSSDGIAEVDSSQVKWGYPKVNYHLTWPQGQTGVMSVNTLPAGTHTVRITDDNHCTTTREFTVGTPEPVKNHLASVRDALCYGYSDGRIETHTTGGVGDYTYVWNTGETTSYADSLKAGLYTIVVTDSHECIDSATYEVGEPEELKVNLGNDVLICPGNIHVFDAGEYATYSWRHAASGEEIATERYLATGDEGDYAIKVTDEIGCIARDTVNITIGENALEANFLMASDAAVNDTIMLVELSNLPVDSVRWEYEPLTVVDIDDAESYMLNLSAENTGRYYITMWAYSGGCESFEQKFIDIYEAVADTSDFKIGYDPLIKQAKVSPNPNDGEFDLIVVLRETYDIDVSVYDVNNGRQVEHVVLKDSDRYNTRLNIRQWGSGIFVLSVSSGTERRAIKVLCVR